MRSCRTVIRTLNKLYKYTISISKTVENNKPLEIVKQFNNAIHTLIKMKLIKC